MNKAVIIEATSGIGRALAVELDARNHAVGISGRRVDRLDDVLDRLSESAEALPMNVTETEEARSCFDELVARLGGGHLVGITSLAAVRASGDAPAPARRPC